MADVVADEATLRAAHVALLDVHDVVQEQVDGAGAALRTLRGAAPSGQAREACRRAEDALDGLLQLLYDTALQLSLDADEQHGRFDEAGSW